MSRPGSSIPQPGRPLARTHTQPDAVAQVNAAKLRAAFALHQQGKFDQAEALYTEILKSHPRHFDALQLLATIAAQRKNSAGAVELFDQALKINPEHAGSHCSRGVALHDLKRHENALESYNRALKIKPDYAEAHYNRGIALHDLKRTEEALQSYDRALKIKPDYAEALNNRGAALSAMNRDQDALESYDRALKIRPDHAESHSNRGTALRDLNRPDEALKSYDRALKLKPDYAEAHWNESLCRLLTGDFDLGWQKYEWRWKREPLINELRDFPQSLWLGDTPISGKTLLLHAEQDLGDTLQFCRYAPLAAAQGARVVLEVPRALKSLCRSLSGVDTLLAEGEPLPPFDFHTPLLSLPLALGTRLDTIPAHIPYLQADPKRVAAWHTLLGQRSKPRIGLAWRGRPAHKNDHNRSLPFALLADLIDDGAEFTCLQKEFSNEDEKLVRQHPNLRIVSERLKDFADTAALIEALDLVITVDTSVAHLAGALGKPVWILLPFSPDWRWLLDREDSPWYPSARLFRQPQFDRWGPVLTEVRQALTEHFAGGGRMEQAAPALPKSGHSVTTRSRQASAAAQEDSAKLKAAYALHQQGRLDQAEALYREILQSQPQHFDALQLLALIAAQRKDSAVAVEMFDRVLEVNPNHASSHSNRGNALVDLERSEEALESYDRALKIEPNYAEALCNRGNVLRDLQRPEEALESYCDALKIKPDYAEALNNRGIALSDLKRQEEALESYDRALKIKPDYVEAQWNESLCRLLTGDFDLGWNKYEWRWRKEPLSGKLRNFPQPLWLGEAPLAGKTLLLHAEQGLGDTLQFCRYAPLVAAQGARVVLEVQPALKSLCRSLPGVDTLLAKGEALPPFDYHVPLLSLPLALGTRLDSIPARVPYLHADPKRVASWHDLLGKRSKPRIGLAWSGSPEHRNDRNRSTPFALLADLIAESIEFICLHKEFRDGEENTARARGVRIVKDELKDFADTAALIETLDLVITVDTSVAHLAGALGKPVWILLPFSPDWRWLLDREDSPWYPSARLYRQPRLDQWAPVVVQVRQAMEMFRAKITENRR